MDPLGPGIISTSPIPPFGGPFAPGSTMTKTNSESSSSTFTISLTETSTGSFTTPTLVSSTVSVDSNSSPTLVSSTVSGDSTSSPTTTTITPTYESETPSSTLNVNLSVNVTVTATLSVNVASSTVLPSNRPFPSSPAGAIASQSNNAPLTEVAGIAVGITAFVLLAVFIPVLLWYYRRKRRREASGRTRDSWANSSVQPEVVRGASPSIRRAPVPRTPTVPNMNFSIPTPPNNPFLSTEEKATLVGFAPSLPQMPQRAPSRKSLHGDFGAMPAGNVSGGPNRGMWRASSDLTPPIEVPEPPYDDPTALPPMPQQGQQSQTMNPLGQNPPTSPNVRVTGRRPSLRSSNASTSEGQDLPESLGRLNQWLEDNRRRSRI